MKKSRFEVCLNCHKDFAAHHVNLKCYSGNTYYRRDESVAWNPYNKVVQSHRDGTIAMLDTNYERAKRGLAVPWTPEIGKKEVKDRSCP